MVSSISGAGLISYYQGQAALGILGSSGSSSGSSSSTSALLSYYQNKEGITSGSSGAGFTATPPTAPWNSAAGTPAVSTAVQNAVNGQQMVDPGSAKLDAPAGVSSKDYRNLFALYQGLNTLYDLASTAAQAGTATADPSLSYLQPGQLQSTFASGMSQVENFLSNAPFTGFNLTAGTVKTQQQSSVGVPNGTYQTYTTGVIASGDESQALSAFQGAVQFTISVASKYSTTTITQANGSKSTVTAPPTNINIDLSNMGSAPRTIDSVVNYINAQLSAAKVTTRFSAANLGTTATTTTLPNGQTQTNKGVPQWGLSINGSSTEQVSFSAPNTAAAVYVSSMTGGAQAYTAPSKDPATGLTTPGGQAATPTGQQMMKLQTGNDVSGSAPPVVTNAGSTSGLPLGAVFAKALPDGVRGVTASATGADGSVYLLANATGAVNSEPVQGGEGVALLKYDSAGKLLYSKVVAGLQHASGASIAVNSDGSVAVAGTNTTTATTAATGLTTPASTSAFVQVYDPTGAPSWSQNVPAMVGTSTAAGVTFGANGAVYLNGQTTGSVGNQMVQGSQDDFIQGFDKTGAATFTKQFGSHGINQASGLVYDASSNTLYSAGLEDSLAVVRSFAVTTTTTGAGASLTSKTTAAAGATRTLGIANSLAGIGLSNGQIVVGGTAGAPTINMATATSPYAGVSSGFIASISTALAASGSDTVAYLGKSGVTQTATAMTVAGGQAYLTGTMANDPSSLAAANATEGFVSGVDTSTGAVSYSSKFAGAHGQDVPSAITVATSGSSILDQLGLPQGQVNAAASNLITAATDTLTTLTNKLNLALSGQGLAQVLTLGANSQLEITPNDPSSFIQLDSQQASNNNPGATASSLKTDVLSALGLSAGVIRQVRQINKLTDVTQLREYGLNLPSNLDLSTSASAQHAANALQAAMSAVQKAYQDLASPPTMATEALAAAANTSGSVPTYLTKQISNLQAGLSRLTGGG